MSIHHPICPCPTCQPEYRTLGARCGICAHAGGLHAPDCPNGPAAQDGLVDPGRIIEQLHGHRVGRREYHSVPKVDTFRHVIASDCACAPERVGTTPSGQDVWAHNAVDGLPS